MLNVNTNPGRVALLGLVAVVALIAPGGVADAKKKKGKKPGQVVTRTASANATGNESIASAVATCPKKQNAVGGGFLEAPIDPSTVTPVPYESQKVGQRSWRASIQLIDPLPVTTVTLTTYAYCRAGAASTSTEATTLTTPSGPVVGPSATQGCDSGRRLVGGGFLTAPPVTGSVLKNQVIGSAPNGSGGWVTTVVSALPSSVTGYAYCARQKKAPVPATTTVPGQPFASSSTSATTSCSGKRTPLAGGFSQAASFGPSSYFLIYESQRVLGGWRASGIRVGTSPSLTLSSSVLCG